MELVVKILPSLSLLQWLMPDVEFFVKQRDFDHLIQYLPRTKVQTKSPFSPWQFFVKALTY
jgi:hypothetical protein